MVFWVIGSTADDPCIIHGCWRINSWLCCLAEILCSSSFTVLIGEQIDWVATQQMTLKAEEENPALPFRNPEPRAKDLG